MVYFVSSATFLTGGTTLMHQGCKQFKDLGLNAKMLYIDIKKDEAIHPVFKSYCLEFEKDWDVVIGNDVVVVPEQFPLINKLLNLDCFRVIWWLSVDNFKVSYSYAQPLGILKKVALKLLLNKKKYKAFDHSKLICQRYNKVMSTLNRKIHLHLSQSEYARKFLSENSIESLHFGDYLTEQFFEFRTNQRQLKEKRVIFNPLKGGEFVKRFLAKFPDWNFTPISNMSASEVVDVMEKSMIYLDLGNHPGQDRIPREAAMKNCVVIVAKRGSACHFEDVPIADKFKIDININFEQNLNNLLINIINDYHNNLKLQNYYREFIDAQKSNFIIDAKKIINHIQKMGDLDV